MLTAKVHQHLIFKMVIAVWYVLLLLLIIQRGVKTIRPKEWGAIFEHVTDPMFALVAETTFEK